MRSIRIPAGADLLPLSELEADPEGWEVLVAPVEGPHRERGNGRWFSVGFLLRPTSLGIVGCSLRDAPSDLYLVVRRCRPEDRRQESLT